MARDSGNRRGLSKESRKSVAAEGESGPCWRQRRNPAARYREQISVSAGQVLPKQRLVVGGPVAEFMQPADWLIDSRSARARGESLVQVRNPQRVVMPCGGQVPPEPEHQLGDHLAVRHAGTSGHDRPADLLAGGWRWPRCGHRSAPFATRVGTTGADPASRPPVPLECLRPGLGRRRCAAPLPDAPGHAERQPPPPRSIRTASAPQPYRRRPRPGRRRTGAKTTSPPLTDPATVKMQIKQGRI
jgi:hypothetical protein